MEDRRVGSTVVQCGNQEYWVLTVRLPRDHSFDGTPFWYKTMVFKSKDGCDLYCRRYSTRALAERGHQETVDGITSGRLELTDHA